MYRKWYQNIKTRIWYKLFYIGIGNEYIKIANEMIEALFQMNGNTSVRRNRF